MKGGIPKKLKATFPCQAKYEVRTAKCESEKLVLIDSNGNVSLPSEVQTLKCELANLSLQNPKVCIRKWIGGV